MTVGFLLDSEAHSSMTDGEITFHLREICAHWTVPRITSATGAELERRKLIEFSEDHLTVRLTPEGVRRKLAGRTSVAEPGINLVRKRQQRQRMPRRFTKQPRKFS
jgi:hypothetical protein